MKQAIHNFLFKPARSEPIAVMRILISLILLGQAYAISGDLLTLYSRDGLLQGALGDYLSGMSLPSISWLQTYASQYGIAYGTTVYGMFLVYAASLTALLLGWHTRVSAFVCWASHFLLIVSGFVFVYGVDHFGNIFLFFLIWMPGGNSLSLDALSKRTSSQPTAGTRLALRVLQFELCIIYFSSGIHKSLGEQWWTGEAIWRSVNLPLYGVIDMQWLAYVPWVATLGAWGTLVIEIGYPFFILPKKTRKFWVLLTVSLHIGISLTIGLHSFSLFMAALTVSIFGVREDPL